MGLPIKDNVMNSNAEVLTASIMNSITRKRNELQELREKQQKLVLELDKLIDQSNCKHDSIEVYGMECATVRCNDCKAEWYDSY